MDSQPDQKQDKQSRFVILCSRHGFSPLTVRLFLILLAIIVGLAAFIVISSRSHAKYTSRTIDFGLKNIGELATQAGYYTNVTSISIPNRTIAGVPIPGTSSKAIATYQGLIRAGINFDQITIDVSTEGKTVTLTLPPTRILSNEIIPDSLEIYDESNNIFNPISITDFNQSQIEMRARAEAQAIENGILEAARENAEKIIRTMFQNTNGTEEYTLNFIWAEPDAE